jgi:preprotein translocase subunit SecG
MQSVLIVIHLLVVIALVAVVLLQRSEGGALGTGGGGGFMTGRGQANALSRATAILGALFFASALLMSILAGWNRAPRSILDSAAPASKAATDSGKPVGQGSLLDQLKGMGDKPDAAPAAPAAVAPTPAPTPVAPAPAPSPAPEAPK